MARTKQRARSTTLSNAERIRRRDKQAQITRESSREFKYFAQLPPDLKLEIFKYFPFYSWATVLSPVCKEWSSFLQKIQCPKILEAATFYYYGFKSDDMIRIARSYQITGLDMSGIFMAHNEEPDVSKAVHSLLWASEQLTWVNLADPNNYVRDLELPSIPAGIKYLALLSWTPLNNDLPNLEQLRVSSDTFQVPEYDRLRFPMLQELHVRIQSKEMVQVAVPNWKLIVAPNLKRIFVKGLFDHQTDEDYTELEELATSLSVQIYCRDLFSLINSDFELFVKSFMKQNLPYNHYTTELGETLLSYACSHGNIKAVKFLLENEYTTIKDELDAAARYACQFAFLLPKTYSLEPDAVVEYLLQSPEYRPVCIDGSVLFKSIVNMPSLETVLCRLKIDLLIKVHEKRVVHSLIEYEWLDVFNFQIEGLSPDQLSAVLSCTDKAGNTPLHEAYLYGNVDFARRLKELGASFSARNLKNNTPLGCCSILSPEFIDLAPSIENDAVITCLQDFNGEALQHLVARGANLNAVEGGKPLIWHRIIEHYPISDQLILLADLGFDFHAVDDRNYSLLYHDIAFFGDNLTHLVREHSLGVNHIAKDGLTPLTHVLKITAEGHGDLENLLEIMNVLIGFGAKISHTNQVELWNWLKLLQNRLKDDAFAGAAFRFLKLIEEILKSGLDLNEIVEEGSKPTRLMQLCVFLTKNNIFSALNQQQFVDLLLKYGGDLNARDAQGNTLAHLIENNNLLFVLLNRGLDPTPVNAFGETAMWNSSFTEMVSFELRHYAQDVNHVSLYGSTVFHHFLISKKDKISSLLTFQPDLSILDGCGRSVAHLLNFTNTPTAVLILQYISKTSTADKVRSAFQSIDKFGHSALYYLVQVASLKTIKQYVDRFGLEINCPSEDLTPLHLSASLPLEEAYEITEFLISRGAIVDAQSLDGNTPLHLACNNGTKDHWRIKQLLLEHGASATTKNKRGFTPLDLDPMLKVAYIFN
jgi:ankyrin repeat protein